MSELSNPAEPYALAVNDDGLIRMVAMYILADVDFRTFEASDGHKAMELLTRELAVKGLLFTNVQMPGFRNGFAVARETAARSPHVAIVLASGHLRPGPGDMSKGTCFIGKLFTADIVHGHQQDILPDGRKPAQLRRRERGGGEGTNAGALTRLESP